MSGSQTPALSLLLLDALGPATTPPGQYDNLLISQAGVARRISYAALQAALAAAGTPAPLATQAALAAVNTVAGGAIQAAGGNASAAVVTPAGGTSAATLASYAAPIDGYAPFVVTAASGLHIEVQKDTAPLNYAGTRAAFVVQQRDAAPLGYNLGVPGAVFQFNTTADGNVTLPNSSTSIWEGLLVTHVKSGDASAQCVTLVGELRNVGAVGYNELGGFQGILSNISSTNGNLSGYELVTQDSGNGGATAFDTAIKNVIARVGRYYNGTKQVVAFMASTEGTYPPDAILVTNTSVASNHWKVGIDFSAATFTTGVAAVFPNNSSLSWLDASGNSQPIIAVNNANIAFIRPASSAAWIDFQSHAGVSEFRVDAYGNIVVSPAASAPLAPTSAVGFFYLPSMAGAPTAIATAAYPGAVPAVVDTTNNKLWVQIGSTWKGVVLT